MKSSRAVELIIFDMDGTLIDSSVTIVNAINHVRHNLGLAPMDFTFVMEKINDHHINPAQLFYETDHFEGDHERWFSEYYTKNHEMELLLYDGIYDLLIALRERGILLSVATNAYRGSAIESLTHLGIYDLFDTIACYDDVSRGKPYPDMLFKILRTLNIHPDKTLFIGDGSRDEIASRRADIDYLMIDWGFSNHQDAIHSVSNLERIIFEKL